MYPTGIDVFVIEWIFDNTNHKCKMTNRFSNYSALYIATANAAHDVQYAHCNRQPAVS